MDLISRFISMGHHTPYTVKPLKYCSMGPSTSNLLHRRSLRKTGLKKTYQVWYLRFCEWCCWRFMWGRWVGQVVPSTSKVNIAFNFRAKHSSLTLKIQAPQNFKILWTTLPVTQHHTVGDWNFEQHYCKGTESCSCKITWYSGNTKKIDTVKTYFPFNHNLSSLKSGLAITVVLACICNKSTQFLCHHK